MYLRVRQEILPVLAKMNSWVALFILMPRIQEDQEIEHRL